MPADTIEMTNLPAEVYQQTVTFQGFTDTQSSCDDYDDLLNESVTHSSFHNLI